MRTLKLIAVVSLLFMLLPFACKDNTVTPTKEYDPGILRTDEMGNILGGDSTDWCWRNPQGAFAFGPAYPNPTLGKVFNIKFTVPVRDLVKLYFLESNNDTIFVENDTLQAGYYTFTVNTTNFFTESYWRLYIQGPLYSPNDSCKNYGDIKFEP